MTAKDVYDYAIVLMDSAGADADNADFEEKAAALIDMLHREAARAEGVTAARITALSDTIGVSDDAALRVLPYGLAAKLALADGDTDKYKDYQAQYQKGLLTLGAEETTIADGMDVLSGLGERSDWGEG
jgi:hypothetical protein